MSRMSFVIPLKPRDDVKSEGSNVVVESSTGKRQDKFGTNWYSEDVGGIKLNIFNWFFGTLHFLHETARYVGYSPNRAAAQGNRGGETTFFCVTD